MSTESDIEQINCNKFDEDLEGSGTNAAENAKTSTDASETGGYQTGGTLPRKQRERRNKSPIAISTLLETFAAPLSPASSSCTSLGNSSADATFEPSVDMMVNDFDDEQTLNEEEALAAMEQQDPHDEIATLQEEGEMPLEELLAKYQIASPPVAVFVGGASKKRKHKRRAGSSKQAKHRKLHAEAITVTAAANIECSEGLTVGAETESPLADSEQSSKETKIDNDLLNEEFDEEEPAAAGNVLVPNLFDENEDSLDELDDIGVTAERIVGNKDMTTEHVDKGKQRRTHLMDLYPEESFTEVLNSAGSAEKDDPLQHDYNEDDDDEGEYINEVEEEEDEFDSDYVKKTIMVGPTYQATIPDGLSQYGDVLPYENEDKLIWEPSQVSEREVEEYLLKARDIKPSLLDNVDIDGEESNQGNHVTDVAKVTALTKANGSQVEIKESTTKTTDDVQSTISATTGESGGDGPAVIKDNEQALHLLVQCGYDFKEALRRKRLNALPLTGTMSLWSEEECHKFEEGIQKFGKDFFKIRQNQVRTRTMRELVQFYYLWKKSDRRDHNFANSDTVDHMDIYLNEGGDYNPAGTNGLATTGTTNSANGSATTLGVHKKNNAQKNSISIMMSGNTTATIPSNSSAAGAAAVATQTTIAPNQLNSSSGNKVTANRKRSVVGVSGSGYENSLAQAISLTAAQMK